MKIVVIDAQGGGIGKSVIESLKRAFPNLALTAVGTNALATSAMLRAGADFAATGENAIRVCTMDADLIICPIGLVLCDAMLGEVTETMAVSVGRSLATRILIPSSKCHTMIAGIGSIGLQDVMQDIVEKVRRFCETKGV